MGSPISRHSIGCGEEAKGPVNFVCSGESLDERLLTVHPRYAKPILVDTLHFRDNGVFVIVPLKQATTKEVVQCPVLVG